MVTTNTCKKCGCEDSFMPSPAPCPTPQGCPNPEPCSEVIDAQCVIYTGTTITCDTDVVVTTNDTVAEALENIVDYICNSSGGGSMTSQIQCAIGQTSANIVIPGTSYNDAIVNVSNYYCGQINNILNNPPAPVPEYTYEIGQYVAAQGGVIMHRWLSTLPNGTPTTGATQNYLVVDLNNLSSAAQYASLNVNIPTVESTFNGQLNTSNLILAGVGSGITVGTAAQLCDVSTNAGLTDWYLPAIDELNKLFNNRWDIAQGINLAAGTQLTFDNYWSSTEINDSEAWSFYFNNGTAGYSNKDTTYYVRAVRRFSI